MYTRRVINNLQDSQIYTHYNRIFNNYEKVEIMTSVNDTQKKNKWGYKLVIKVFITHSIFVCKLHFLIKSFNFLS